MKEMTIPVRNTPLRVTHVITGLNTGGAEMMLLKVVRAGSRNVSHEIVSLGSCGSVGPQLEQAGANVYALDLKPGALPFFGGLRLANLLNHLRPDVVQGWMYHGNLAAACARMGMIQRSPLCWSVRCSVNTSGTAKWLTRTVTKACALLSHRVSAIVYNSNVSRVEHQGVGYSDARAIVIPNGFDTLAFQPDAAARDSMRRKLAIPMGHDVVGLVARNHPMKDHATFLAAAVRVARERPNVTFVVAGAEVTHLAETQSRIAAELGSRLKLLPEQSNVAELMNGFDIFVLCSAWGEGFPNVLGEAMACGLVCIATDVGDCAAIISGVGTVVSPRSPEMLATAIVSKLSDDPSHRRQLGDSARARVIERYALPEVARRYEDVWLRASLDFSNSSNEARMLC